MEQTQELQRWRLILGQESDKRLSGMNMPALTEEQDLMDKALAAIYNKSELGGFGSGGDGQGGFGKGSTGAGRGPSNPQISRWLGDVRTLFDKDLVKVIQNDAMNRCGLKQLIFEPELLENAEPDINLASTILTLKEMIPKRSKDSVRAFIRKIVEEINRLLEQDIRRAVTAAVNKRAHSPIPSAAALDYKMTISRNLKHYSPELKTIIPEHFYFSDRASKTAANKWTVILDIDQSGSMGESVIYSSVVSCILASMSALKTRIVAFDTSIVDLTEKSADPVDLLYGFQLGGGTDIDKSVVYCQQFIENPKKTLFFLISDLMEGGNRAAFVRRMEEMKSSGVTVVCLLALADKGKPYYDEQMAQKLSGYGIPCFACNPQRLPELLERVLKGQDLGEFVKSLEGKKK